MAALSMPIIPSDAYTPLELACDLVVQSNKRVRRLYEKIEEERQRTRLALQYIDQEVAAGLRSGNHKSKRVGPFVVKTGYNTVSVCACHGALRSDCDTLGDVQMIGLQSEPWVSVKPSSADE